MTEVYSVTAKLMLSDGTSLDISSHIRELKITQSNRSKYIYYDLLISNQFLKYINADLSHVFFDIRYKGYKSIDQKIYNLSAKPVNYPMPMFYQEFQSQSPYKDYTWIHLIDTNIYDILSKRVESKIYKNKTLLEIVNDNIDINIEVDPTINDTRYEQIFIPTMTFENLLEYLNYWYGFYSHSSDTLVIYNPYDLDVKLRIVDLHYRMTSGRFDFIIYKHSEKDSIDNTSRVERENDNTLVINSPIEFKNNLPQLATFNSLTVIEKPEDTLAVIHKDTIEEFLNNNAIVDRSVNFQEDSVTTISDTNVSIRTHVYKVPVYSMLSSEFNGGNECTVVLENKDIFQIWPSYIVNLMFSTPDLANFQGLYHVDVVRYHFKFKDAYWRNITTLICERTNYLRR